MLFLKSLTDTQKHNAYKAGKLFKKPARSLLIRQGQRADGIYVICSGEVESVRYTETDRELRLACWGKNDFIGAPNVFGNAHQQWSARAVSEVLILHLNQSCLRKLMDEDVEFAVKLIQSLGKKGERYSELAQRLAFHTVSERVALSLLESWEDAREVKTGKPTLALPSLLDLSKEVGATRQAAGLAIRSLQEKGLLNVDQGRFLIPNVEGLRNTVSE